jgi:putative beta-lysine N-acetyltransferase
MKEIQKTQENIQISDWGYSELFVEKDFTAKLDFSAYNKRISVLEYELSTTAAASKFFSLLDSLCLNNGFDKVWGKIRQDDVDTFTRYGFLNEALIRDFFAENIDAVICSKFFGDRRFSRTPDENARILQQIADRKKVNTKQLQSANEYSFRIAGKEDLPALADLYREVFATYPYPIHNTAFLESSLEHTVYGLVFRNEVLLGAASAEIDFARANAEMTDFATLSSEQGKGLASFILHRLEEELQKKGIKCFYSIARSTSVGMNLTFSRASYQYTGTLVNNCNISGGFEDMNVYCKSKY